MDPIARYTPKKLDDTVNIKARIEMCDWLESWETKRKVDSVKNAILLWSIWYRKNIIRSFNAKKIWLQRNIIYFYWRYTYLFTTNKKD